MKGQCLCGSITIEAAEKSNVSVCHCSICRRWSGAPMFAIHCGKEVTISGEAPAKYASSDWAERGFCATCGTHLFYFLPAEQEYFVPAGIFQSAEFSIASEIFIDEKPSYYDLHTDVEKLTGAQVFELFEQKK